MSDSLEQEMRADLSQQVDDVVRALDGRMAAHFGRAMRRHAQRGRRVGLWLRPAVSLAALALAVGLGFFWGRQQADTGPRSAAGPVAVVSKTEEPALLALQRLTSHALPMGLAEAPAGAGLREALAESAPPAKSEAEDAAGAVSLAAAPPAPTAEADDATGDGLWAEGAASVAWVGEDVIAVSADRVVRVRADGTGEVLGAGLDRPKGVATDAGGQVFVTEYRAEGRLLALAPDGAPRTILDGLNYPAGIAVASDRSLFLAEQGRGRILRVLPDGATITARSRVEVYSTGFSGILDTAPLDGRPLLGGPFALAITSDNALLVSDLTDGQTVVYRFALGQSAWWWERLWAH